MISFTSPNYGALRDLVPFVQFKKREKHQWRSVTFSRLKPATLLKVTFFHGCFWRFLNRTYGTKSRNAHNYEEVSETVGRVNKLNFQKINHMNLINPFNITDLFIPPENIIKPEDF